MNIAIWIAIALVCFVLPAVALTSGGKKAPERGALAKYATQVGLPLTDEVVDPVIARIRRRERGMSIGGISAIVLGGLAAIVLDGSETWGSLVVPLAGAGVGLGGAWAMSAYRPSPTADQPVVARIRTTSFGDYLTAGERFALIAGPAAVLIGAVAGALLLRQLPADIRGSSIAIGLVGTALALATWAVAMLTLRRLLDAPARSGSDLELAWDDAERALGLRQVTDLITAMSCIVLGIWLLLMVDRVTATGFYRSEMDQTMVLTIVTGLIFTALIAVVAAGPVHAWLSGQRKGYEQRRLWPHGVSVT